LDALGHHLLIELYGCDVGILDNCEEIERVMNSAALLANAHIVESAFHQFNPHGISGVVIIAESHFSIHTWPEHGYAAVDIFTCGDDIRADLAYSYMISHFKAKNSTMVEMKRGIIPLPVLKANELMSESGETVSCRK
jgi:S-adenosylmethionine decarboxylase